ncbi:MAG: FkbM family methyltransferase [Paracoccaceae bacterium]
MSGLDDARAALRARARELESRLGELRDRRRGAVNRELHEIGQMLRPADHYASQAGQDRMVERLTDGRRGGTFVDIGGYDGVTGSNTFWLEAMKGWTGLLVEPMPAQFQVARAVRRCECLQAAVSDRAGDAEFIAVREGYTQMSGLAATYDPALLARVRADRRHVEETIRVATLPLADIFERAGMRRPDFASLDVEGGEVAALAALDWGTYRPRVWAIENNGPDPMIGQIMKEAGYALVDFAGQDEIWRDSRG